MRDIRQRPSLWQHIRSWDNGSKSTRRLTTGPILVSDAAVAHEVFSRPSNYVAESAFLRTRSYDPLPQEHRGKVISDLMAAIEAHPPSTLRLNSDALPTGRWLRTQSWGIRLMRTLYADALAFERSPAIDQLIDRFVERKTIRDDVWGTYRRLGDRERSELHTAMGRELEVIRRATRTEAGPQTDLAGRIACLDLPLPPIERGELFFRLVQSVVAFTGAALEMATYVATTTPDIADDFRAGRSRKHILELQRVYPTAWRLARRAAVRHQLGDVDVSPGDEIIVATSTVHRAVEHWASGNAYCPQQWEDASMTRPMAYFPFGRGRGMCPGRNVAVDVLEETLTWLHRRYSVEVRGDLMARPYVRSILSAPTCKVRFTMLRAPTGGFPVAAGQPSAVFFTGVPQGQQL